LANLLYGILIVFAQPGKLLTADCRLLIAGMAAENLMSLWISDGCLPTQCTWLERGARRVFLGR